LTDSGLFFLSIIFFIISIYFIRKPNKIKYSIIVYFILTIGSFLLFITYGISDYFTGNGIDEATIYHLKYGLGGAGFLEYKELIIISITIIVTGFILLFWFLIKKKKSNRKYQILFSYILIIISLLMNPASIDLYDIFNIDFSESDEFYKYYRKPEISQINDPTKNLVFIYAEGLELTYFYQDVFPDLVTELQKIKHKSTYFTNINQVPGNRFTIGGIVNSQLGISLVTPSFENSMSGMDQYLPSAVGLGDLLNTEGYFLSFMGGANLSFAGKGKFFRTHGFDEVLGRDELVPKLKDKKYLNGWGLYDDTLLELVYNRFIELSKKEKKFGLFTLTLDTHHPNGHISKTCGDLKYKDGKNPILNAVSCSDRLLSNFINRIIDSPFAHQTIIVLVSDHLSLKNSAYNLLEGYAVLNGIKTKIERKNLFMIIDPMKLYGTKIKAAGSNLDIGPTILPFLGYKGEIGLGRNILEGIKPGESVRKYKRKNRIDWKNKINERKYIRKSLKKWKGTVVKFWGFPKINNSIYIDLKKKSIIIENRKFKIPILIELDEQLNSILKFQFDINNKKQTLIEHLFAMDEDKFFILIDKGKNVKVINNNFDGEDLYLISGKGNKYTKMFKIDKNITLTTSEIHQLLKDK